MTSLRRFIVFLITALTIIFNLERLDIGQANLVDIQSFVYGLVFAAAILMVAVPFFQRLPVYTSIAIWIVVYFALRLLVFTHRPIVGGMYTYLTITELALLSITVLLTHVMTFYLKELEKVVEDVSFPPTSQRVQNLEEASEAVKTEFIRSRRYDRPLSVLVIELTSGIVRPSLERVVRELQQSMIDRYLTASLARVITKEARRTDVIIKHERNDRMILLCPETPPEHLNVVKNRITTVAQRDLGLELSIGGASFPCEALTFEDLLKIAESNIQRMSPENDLKDENTVKVESTS